MTDGNDIDAVAAPEDAFAFGRNWQRYVAEYLDPERERIAAESLRDLLGVDLRGRDFLDIGAGSGLFSLCAQRMAARSVVSVDVDPDCVESCRRLRRAAGDPDGWEVIHGSILDRALVGRLEPADVVYSWGVLHHTGDMWTAIRNAAELVRPGGLFAIAIYNRVEGRYLDSERWSRIKLAYNHGSPLKRRAMQAAYESYWFMQQLRHRSNPLRVAAEYRNSRGMALRTDLLDWLGGYPYEYASSEEVIEFCERECGLRTSRATPASAGGHGNNQFVFTRP